MELDTDTIVAIVMRIKTFLDYKRISTLRKKELFEFLSWESIQSTKRNIESRPKLKSYISPMFTSLSNMYGSCIIDLNTLMAFIFDFYVRTGKPLTYKTKLTDAEIMERIRFLSAYSINEQIDLLKGLHEEYSAQSKFNKFSGKQSTIFGVDEKQENKLYELVKNGKVSYLLFAFFLGISKFSIDETKIDDLSYLRFVKIINYINKKQIKQENIKYEV